MYVFALFVFFIHEYKDAFNLLKLKFVKNQDFVRNNDMETKTRIRNEEKTKILKNKLHI